MADIEGVAERLRNFILAAQKIYDTRPQQTKYKPLEVEHRKDPILEIYEKYLRKLTVDECESLYRILGKMSEAAARPRPYHKRG
jgi:hypothetical protein